MAEIALIYDILIGNDYRCYKTPSKVLIKIDNYATWKKCIYVYSLPLSLMIRDMGLRDPSIQIARI